jgi:squalene cyclase
MVAGCASRLDQSDPAIKAELRAVSLLAQEVPAWSRDNHCFSCHNNGDGARALYEASRKGHRIPSAALKDTTTWLARPDRWDKNKGDPGFSDQRLANIQFAASLLAATEAGRVRKRGSLRDAAMRVAADQDADGSWPIDAGNDAGSPATYGTTLATFMAWRVLRNADAPGTAEAVRKAGKWFRQSPSTTVLAAATSILSLTPDAAESARTRQRDGVELLRRAQTRDGGWGPYADSPPEAFDTAIALLALAETRETPGVEEMIQRGRSFLMAQQHPDGGWPATTRPSGGQSYAQRTSTTGWAMLALLATRP